ncbi:Cullin-domain-containing protein [Punctularia strigosozonata HHB-11173 SS5]|uniref:Cullin-domain-containing protein n=1 Tax=Punctularia strigosozonata (strain HHB-11173) TaxID=741275 RepID=UPI0004416509|nr:Cullin-domain-containing protein [Punctularia strigosozonata HHB-11173 SS5]EIN09693.1 Cullin-domain-containing protein [Punctularia strigosozonata HHB-11173 SS5]
MASTIRRGKPKIKPPKKHGPDVPIEDIWTQLSNNIREIHKQNASRLSFEENHRFAYNIVLSRKGEMLYNGVCDLVVENLENLAAEQIIPAFPTGNKDDLVEQSQEWELLLKALRNVWDEHQANMSKLSDILKYMDRVYTKNAGVPEIWDAGMNLFRKHILRPPIQPHLVTAILQEVRLERDGFTISRSAVKGCVDVMLQLDDDKGEIIYKRDLEPVLLKESEAYYKAEGEKLMESCDAPEYLRRAEDRFVSEELRAIHYLSNQTAAPLQRILESALLTPHLQAIIGNRNSDLDVMIDTDRKTDLARLYKLFVKVPTGLPCLRRAIKDTLATRGKEINSLGAVSGSGTADGGEGDDAPEPTGKGKGKAGPPGAQLLQVALKWVEDVLALKDKFDTIWTDSFASDRDLEGGINEAFESFINQNERAPEYISLFIDENLKKGLKGKTDEEVEAVLDKTITVFRYVTEKDVFERYYKGHLAKRLLLGKSVSDDAERGMLAKLKVESGHQFTQKLEGMFTDMKVSADTMAAYRTYLNSKEAPDVDINVIVMTSTYWPMPQPSPQCNLPLALTEASKVFEKFYLGRHSGRRLTWQPSLGNADVRVTFKARKHDLNVSTFALVILLLFEDLSQDEFLTYEEIKTATAMPEQELQRNLQSLACAKYKILKKHPPGRNVNPGDSFSFNYDFTCNLQKIKISTVSSRPESTEERKETKDRIEEERKHQTDACIVRIMKDRKHMTHNDLINEATRQLASRFQPQPLDIKKRIENLIEREYLERCSDRRSYNYLA